MKKLLILPFLLLMLPLLQKGKLGGVDISTMEPVQTVLLQEKDGKVYLYTDTGGYGIGATAEEAVAYMAETASKKQYLDTATYLLCTKGAETALSDVLRPSCRICYVSDKVDPKKAGEYLSIHELPVTLSMYEGDRRDIPLLIEKEGGFCLVR